MIAHSDSGNYQRRSAAVGDEGRLRVYPKMPDWAQIAAMTRVAVGVVLHGVMKTVEYKAKIWTAILKAALNHHTGVYSEDLFEEEVAAIIEKADWVFSITLASSFNCIGRDESDTLYLRSLLIPPGNMVNPGYASRFAMQRLRFSGWSRVADLSHVASTARVVAEALLQTGRPTLLRGVVFHVIQMICGLYVGNLVILPYSFQRLTYYNIEVLSWCRCQTQVDNFSTLEGGRIKKSLDD